MRREFYGKTKKGETVDIFTLQNKNGMAVKFINYGCRITNILLPSENRTIDALLGCDDISGYERDISYQGALLGRYANRIKGASFSLAGKRYPIMKNDGANYLHGSMHTHVFEVSEDGENGVVLSSVSPDGEDGFPGEVKLKVSLALDDDDRFTIGYWAVTNADTHINISHHPYFDLSGGTERTIENHSIRLNSHSFLEAGEDFVPTGRVIDATGGAFDFTKEKAVSRDIDSDDPQLKITGGYDHSYVIDGYSEGESRLAAEVFSPGGKLKMSLYTTQPAVHLYTGNVLSGSLTGKGRSLSRRAGLCLETQHYPDSPNQPAFPSTLLRAGEEYRETTILKFEF
jgi:aldose 1-epimerase